MYRSCHYGWFPACNHSITRRNFVKSCGMVVATGGWIASSLSLAEEPKNKRVRVGLVFLSNQGESWPHPEFDVEARQKEVRELLSRGCPAVEFVPVEVRSPEGLSKAISMKDQVDGYLVYVVTLTWPLTAAITTIGKLGKPMVVADQAAEWADRWTQEADKVVEPTPEWLRKAGAVYLAMLELLKRYNTDTVTMNCLGGFGAGQLPAYPCLGFMQLLNDGGHGVCEAMPDDTISTLMVRILTGRPSYVSDPVLDTARNHIVYAHCMATSKAFGPKGPANMYRIRTLHNRDPRGTCVQSFLPVGYMTTSFRTNFASKMMVIHQAKSVGNLDAPRGCRTQLIGEVRGDIGRLFNQWDLFGWHRVTIFGDVKEQLLEFGKALGLDIVEEA